MAIYHYVSWRISVKSISASCIYSWVWKKATEKSRYRLFDKITTLFEEINEELSCTGIKLCINSEYAPEYLKKATEQYAEAWQIDETMFVHGRGHRKTTQSNVIMRNLGSML